MITSEEVRILSTLTLENLLSESFDLIYDFFTIEDQQTISQYEFNLCSDENTQIDEKTDSVTVYEFLDYFDLLLCKDKLSVKYAKSKRIVLIYFIKEKLKNL